MDPTRALATTDELLAHTAWVRALARSLLGSSEADDLAQDALVAALENPPRSRGRPWLVRIVQNLASKRRRERARRNRREVEAASPTTVPGPEELAQRAALQRDVVQAVIALEEPYRSTILLHYFEELPVGQVAEVQRVSEGAVRQRLKRGRDQLRERLDRRYGTRACWAALVTGLLERSGPGPARPIDLSRAGALAGAGARAAWILLGISALGAGVLLVTRGGSARGSPPFVTVGQGSRAVASGTPVHVPEPPRASRTRVGMVPPVAKAGAVTPGELLVHAVWKESGEPAVGEIVRIQVLESELPYPEVRHARIDGAGMARMALPAGEARVGLLRNRDDDAWATIVPGETAQLEFTLEPGVTVTGEVVDELGGGIADAEIWLSEAWQSIDGHVVATTDERGRFSVPGVQLDGGNWLGARAALRAPSPVQAFEGFAPGEVVRIRIALERPGGAIVGRAVDEMGTSVPGAELQIGHASDAWSRGRGAPPLRVRADENGRFEAHGLPLGRMPVRSRAPGHAAFTGEIEVFAGSPLELTLVLRAPALVSGRVADAAGRPLEGVRVVAGEPGGFSSAETRSDAGGSYSLTGAELGPTRLRALGPGVGDETVLELRSAVTSTWNPVLRPVPAISGTVVDPGGRPVPGREIEWFVGSERRSMRWTASDEEGRFALPRTDDVEHTLLVSAARGFPAAIARGVRPSSAPLELRIEDPTASALLVLEVVGPDGAPAPGPYLRIDHRDRGLALEFSAALGTGRFELEVPAGTCELSLRSADLAPRALGARSFQAGERVDLGRIELGPAARVSGAVQGPLSGNLRSEWFDGDGRLVGRANHAGIRHRSPPLPAGTGVLVLQGDGVQRLRRSFTVQAGEEQVLDLELAPAATRRLRLEWPPDEPRPGWVRGIAHDAAGEVVWSWDGTVVPDGALELLVSSAPGTVRLHVETDVGLQAKTLVEVVAPSGPAAPRVLALTR